MNILNLEGNSLAVALVIAVFVALFVELVKLVDKKSILTSNLINLLSLLIGWSLAMIAMKLLGGQLDEFTFIGLGAGVASSGIYEITNNLFGTKIKEDE